MRISRTLPQFTDAPALLLVTGTQQAVAYRASDGTIVSLMDFRTPKPSFTDREGHSERRARGAMVQSEAIREVRRQELRATFRRDLCAQLTRAVGKQRFDLVYLFAPAHIVPVVRAALPATLRSRVARVVRGNYHDAHPLELVKMVTPAVADAAAKRRWSEGRRHR